MIMEYAIFSTWTPLSTEWKRGGTGQCHVEPFILAEEMNLKLTGPASLTFWNVRFEIFEWKFILTLDEFIHFDDLIQE